MIIDRGSPVLVEAEFKKHDPFNSTLVYFDPTTATITITSPDGTKVADTQNLTKSATGKWYYIHQTTINSLKGAYNVSVTATLNANSDVTINPSAFALK